MNCTKIYSHLVISILNICIYFFRIILLRENYTQQLWYCSTVMKKCNHRNVPAKITFYCRGWQRAVQGEINLAVCQGKHHKVLEILSLLSLQRYMYSKIKQNCDINVCSQKICSYTEMLVVKSVDFKLHCFALRCFQK